MVGPAIGAGRCPGGAHQIGDRQAGRQQLALQRRDVARVDQRVVDRGDRILPDQVLGRHVGAQVARFRPHVAVAQLEPRPGEGVGEVCGVRPELLHHLAICRVDLHRHVGGGHHRRHAAVGAVRAGRQRLRRVADRLPLLGARRAAHQFVFMVQQHVEIGHVPLDRRGRPRALDAAGDRVIAKAAFVRGLPAQAHLRDVRPFRLGPHQRGVARAVRLAERVAARGQRDGFLVVHAHPRERLADVARRLRGVGVAARPLGIDVDEAHLDRGKRAFQHHLAVGLDAGLVVGMADPFLLGAPVDVLLRLVIVLAAAAEAEHRAAHRLDRDVAGQDEQVRPAELAAVFLLDRPQQPARLVQVGVVRPAVERGEPLRARGRTAAPVAGAIGAGRMPCHADEERAVMAIVRRPPRLAVGHQRAQVRLHRFQVERQEFLRIVEIVAPRIAGDPALVEDVERQLVGPPVAVGAAQQRAQRARLLHRAAQRAAIGDLVHRGHLLSTAARSGRSTRTMCPRLRTDQ